MKRLCFFFFIVFNVFTGRAQTKDEITGQISSIYSNPNGNENGFTMLTFKVKYRMYRYNGLRMGYDAGSFWDNSTNFWYNGTSYSYAQIPQIKQLSVSGIDVNMTVTGPCINKTISVEIAVGGNSSSLGGNNTELLFKMPADCDVSKCTVTDVVIRSVHYRNFDIAINAIEKYNRARSQPSVATVIKEVGVQPQSYYSNQRRTIPANGTSTAQQRQPTWQETNARIQAENQQRFAQQQQRNAQIQRQNQEAADQIRSGVTELVGTISDLLANARAEKAKKEAQRLQAEQDAAEEKREAEEQANEIVRRHALTLELRNSFFAEFPEGGVPLSADNVQAPVLYYFTYVFDKSTIAATSAEISLSNIFPIAKYGDDTWPFKTSIIDGIQEIGARGNITLVGYFTTYQLADEMRSKFLDLAGKSEFTINNISYRGKPANASNNAGGADFWSSPGDAAGTAKTTVKGNNDFWEAPKNNAGKTNTAANGTSASTTTKVKPAANSDDDFWGPANNTIKNPGADTTAKKPATNDDFWATDKPKPAALPKKTTAKKSAVKKKQ